MRNRQAQFSGDQRSRKRRIGVSVEQHPVWLFGGYNRLQALQHFAGLNSVSAGAHVEVVVRPGDRQFLEKDGTQLRIIVLAGMDDPVRPSFAGIASLESPVKG